MRWAYVGVKSDSAPIRGLKNAGPFASKIPSCDFAAMSISADPPLNSRSLLVLGGARSGKSAYALRVAEEYRGERLFLATAAASDPEMATRIASHRAERGENWSTLEEPLDLCGALGTEARKDRIIVVDCLTLWLSNVMFVERDPLTEIEKLCLAIESAAGPIVLVSNEVGAGIVPETKLGRDFRDWHGRLNQKVASASGVVVLIVAGMPQLLKPTPSLRVEMT
jgi:adenosylcobinamide kinase/adenosylcobinamide-phosphate guanylyltransferase